MDRWIRCVYDCEGIGDRTSECLSRITRGEVSCLTVYFAYAQTDFRISSLDELGGE
jgi:hypothetical protein